MIFLSCICHIAYAPQVILMKTHITVFSLGKQNGADQVPGQTPVETLRTHQWMTQLIPASCHPTVSYLRAGGHGQSLSGHVVVGLLLDTSVKLLTAWLYCCRQWCFPVMMNDLHGSCFQGTADTMCDVIADFLFFGPSSRVSNRYSFPRALGNWRRGTCLHPYLHSSKPSICLPDPNLS